MIPLWFGIFLVFAVGILLSCYHLVIPTLIICLGLVAIAIMRSNYARSALTGLLVLGFGWFYYDLIVPPQPVQIPALSNQVLQGQVTNYPSFDGRTASFILRTEHQDSYRQNIQVFCFFNPNLRKGDRVRLQGDLKPPAPPGNPGELDYPAYLRYNHIYYILSIKEKGAVRLIERDNGPSAWLVNYQLQARDVFKQVLSEDDANILLGMLLGIVEGIDPEEYRDYQKTGIIHVFSVSGMHIAFLLLVAVWMTELLGLGKKGRLAVGLLLLLAYGGLTGWPAPVLRSAIMGALGLVAYYSGRENGLLNSLGLAGTVILLLNPTALLQMSFQFTFLATWGLVYLFPLIKKSLKYQSTLWDLVLIPLCAQIPMLPLLIYHFNLFSPVSVLSNILLGYLSGAAVVFGFIALILARLPFLAALFLNPAGLMIEMVRGINHLLVQLPGAFFWVAAPKMWPILAYYLGLLLVLYALVKKMNQRWLVGGALLMAVLMVQVFVPASLYNRGMVEEVFIDVGQGDSILIKTPQGKFILVDGGGSEFSDVAHRKLLPYLHYRGIREIWLAVNTHPDTDHLQGLETVLEELPVRQVAIPASLASSDKYQGLKDILNQKAIPLIPLAAGERLQIEDGLNARVLYPDRNLQQNDTNEQSLVLRFQYGSFSTLLTGDLRIQGLHNLLGLGDLAPVTVVKVPHHGSKGSLLPAFYDETNPRWAVISVGANNRFGHPNREVLEELERRQIKVYRTDQCGAITVETDGQTVSIKPYR